MSQSTTSGAVRRFPPWRLLVGLVVLIAATVWLSITGDAAPAVLLGTGLVLAAEGLSELADRRQQHRKDLDETRRLLYMALAVEAGAYLGSVSLAGSVANALAHHSKRLSVAKAQALAESIAGGRAANPEYAEEIRGLIVEITDKLGDAAPPEG